MAHPVWIPAVSAPRHSGRSLALCFANNVENARRQFTSPGQITPQSRAQSLEETSSTSVVRTIFTPDWMSLTEGNANEITALDAAMAIRFLARRIWCGASELVSHHAPTHHHSCRLAAADRLRH